MLFKTRRIGLEITRASLYVRIGSLRGFEAFIRPGSGLSTWNLFVKDEPNYEPC
ncbi:hypothetical protein [Microbaculum marinisediminis]|uniref:Uncharacterized protein n=1 Tax=Microbaculum marinisediminis TaxID=2931392 RepID=A0AAW5R3S0_9HYPH|nr:hypothetical protein [Microbaculum sp. A6E488]MCT8973249.1 hypothetical protein [Microbaculum sp. A6E488]